MTLLRGYLLLGWLLVSAIFLLAGLRDYLGGIELAGVRRWVQRLKTMPFAWVD